MRCRQLFDTAMAAAAETDDAMIDAVAAAVGVLRGSTPLDPFWCSKMVKFSYVCSNSMEPQLHRW
jgi:hypothetical protein